ncbi:MAG: AGE family epimerase/isomerase [Acidobacteria bacterium]|nr:AGE family epimerase/isomerase [Acidobacteriota bacterium]
MELPCPTPSRRAFLALLPALGPAQSPALAPRMQKALRENILPFWLERSLDRQNGGYTIHFGPRGEPKGEGTKMIVTQARTVWLFARATRAGHGRHLEAAEHGYRFLKDKMWDPRHGGFYWETDAAGDRVPRPKKHLYGQSFGLYALSEYALATGRKDVLDFAIRFFELLEAKSHDREFGGYFEFFNADWSAAPPGETTYMGEPGLKLMNTHLHLLEAMTTFYRASRLPLARERLLELIAIESSAVVRKGITACTDKYERNWKPRLDGNYARVSYGHDLENIWLLIDACKAAEIPCHPYADLFRELFAYSMKYGWDEQHGGFFDSGAFHSPADQRAKTWWVQSEALVSALYMHRLTREPAYLEVFDKTWRFIDQHQIDWVNGEWHATITPNLEARGDKASIWKAGYHNGRAMIECLEALKT